MEQFEKTRQALIALGVDSNTVGSLQEFTQRLSDPKQQYNTWQAFKALNVNEKDLGDFATWQANLLGHGVNSSKGKAIDDRMIVMPETKVTGNQNDARPAADIPLDNKQKDIIQRMVSKIPQPEHFDPKEYDEKGNMIGYHNWMEEFIAERDKSLSMKDNSLVRTANAIGKATDDLSTYFKKVRFDPIERERLQQGLSAASRWNFGQIPSELVRGVFDATMGATSAAFNVMPAVAIMNQIQPEVKQPIVDIIKKTGLSDEKSNYIFDMASGFAFGKTVGVFSMVGQEMEQLAPVITPKNWSDEDKARVKEGLNQVGFLGGIELFGHIMNRAAEKQNQINITKEQWDYANYAESKFNDLKNEIVTNNNVINTMYDTNNDTPEKVNSSVASMLELTPEQTIKFGSILNNLDGTDDIRQEMYKKFPSMLKDPEVIGKAVFMGIKDPAVFKDTYGIDFPDELHENYVDKVEQFLRDEGIHNKMSERNYETKQAIETVVEETPLPEKRESKSITTTSTEGAGEEPITANIFEQSEINFQKGKSSIASAAIKIGDNVYEGQNHDEAIEKARLTGEDISKIDKEKDGLFHTTDDRLITRDEAEKEFGIRHSEEIIPQQTTHTYENLLQSALQPQGEAIDMKGSKYPWARRAENNYEVSSRGDKRFSALNAKLSNGKTIEEIYQTEIKGYNTIQEGKGKPPKNDLTKEQSYEAYKKLWKQWAIENPELIQELKEKAKGKTLTDMFASSEINQARALSDIISSQPSKLLVQAEKIVPTRPNEPVKASELLSRLEQSGNYDPSIAHFTKWAAQYAHDPLIHSIDSNTLLRDGSRMGGNAGVFTYDPKTAIGKIGINKDFTTNDPAALYRTVSHEVGHAAIQQELKNNVIFRNQVKELMNDLQKTLREDGVYKPEHNDSFKNESEFIAHTMSNTGGLTDLMKNTPIRNGIGSNFLERLKSLIKGAFARLFELKDPSYYQGMEKILENHLGYKSQDQYFFGGEHDDIKDDTFEHIDASFDKQFMITNQDMMDPRAISATAQLLGKEKGLEVKDYYDYIAKMPYNSFKTDLLSNSDFNTRAQFHYDKTYSKTFPTVDKYKEAVAHSLYNQAQTMEKIPVSVLTLEDHWIGGQRLGGKTILQEFPDVFKDKNGNTKVSMNEHLKIFDATPDIESLLGVKLQWGKLDHIETKHYNDGQYTHSTFSSIAESSEPDKNKLYENILSAQGKIYPGSWSDKKTILYATPSKAIDPEVIKQIADHYQEKSKALVQRFLTNGYKDADGNKIEGLGEERVNNLIKDNGSLENVLKELHSPLSDYLMDNRSQGRIVRMLLEDMKLGGRVVDGQLVSSLFNPERKETYDALAMLKRANLVSPTRAVHQDPIEVKSIMDGLSIANHGMSMTDKGVTARTAIVDVENIDPEKMIDVGGKPYSLKKLLTNAFSTARMDGPVFYVRGGFNDFYHEIHGTTKRGVIKAWAGNNYTDFRNPLYVKAAFFGLSANDPLGKWMQDNNLTLLVSSTAAKISAYPKGNFMGDDIEKSVFSMPFNEIQRIGEKGSTSDDAIGLPQTFTSNFMTRANKSFVDMGWGKAKDDMMNYTLKEFHNKVADINPASVIEHIINESYGTSEQNKSIADVASELLMKDGNTDYRQLKDNLPLNATKEQKRQFKKDIAALKMKSVAINDRLGKKYSNFLQEPFFAQGIKSYIGRMLSDVTNFAIPASHLTLQPDLGVLSLSRLEKIREHVTDLFRKEKTEGYNEMKPYITLKNQEAEIDQKFINEKDETIKAGYSADKHTIADQLGQYESQMDKYEDELSKYYDKNGNVNFHSESTKQAIEEKLSKYVNETGHLKNGYTMISKDFADLHGVKVGDKVVSVMVPSSNGMSAMAHEVVAILPEDMMEQGSLLINSEYAQSILGKDYDIDQSYVIPKSQAFTDEGWKGFTSTLEESYKKHREDIKDFYKKNVGQELQDPEMLGKDEVYNPKNNIYGKDPKIKLLTTGKYSFQPTDFPKGKLFHPINDGFEVLDKFKKEISKVVNLRKNQTFKSDLGLKTQVGDQIINTDHPRSYSSYMKLDAMTHHMVDMPVDTGGLHYTYDAMRGYDMVNGTHFYDDMSKATTKLQKALVTNKFEDVNSFEDYLFTYAMKLNTDYNNDDRQNVRTYEDSLKYIGTQKDINSLLAKKDYQRLLTEYDNYLKMKFPGNKTIENTRMKSIAAEYLKNLSIENLNGSAMNELSNRIPLHELPNVTTSETDYNLTQGNIIASIMNDPKFKIFKDIYDSIGNSQAMQAIINRESKSGTKIQGLDNIDSNRLAVKMFYLTSGNPALHDLKVKLVSLIYPVDQSTTSQSQVDKLAKDNYYYRNIYEKTNADTYPMLFDELLKTRSYEFKDKTNEAQIGDITLKKTVDNQLAIVYKDQRYNAQELVNDNSVLGQSIKAEIKKQLATNPQARVNLSKLLSLGGRNTSLSGREALAIDMIDKKLGKFTPTERATFWMSLLGKPQEPLAYPTNLVKPQRSTTNTYQSQKILLHVLGQVKDDIAKRFLDLYAQKFNDEYVGPTLQETQRVQRIIQNNEYDQNVEVYFQGKRGEENQKKLKGIYKDETSFFDKDKTIFDLIPKGVRDTPMTRTPVKVFDWNSFSEERTIEVTNKMITSAYTPHDSNNIDALNAEGRALWKAQMIGNDTNVLRAVNDSYIEKFAKDNVDEYVKLTTQKKNLLEKITHPIANPKELLEAEGNARSEIRDIITKNKLSLESISRVEGNYIIKDKDGRSFSYNPVVKPGIGYSGTFDDYLKELNLGDKILLHRVAMKRMIQTGVDNVNHAQMMVDDIDRLIYRFAGSDFGRLDKLYEYRKRWQQIVDRFKGQGIIYTPDIIPIEKGIEIVRQSKNELTAEVNRRIDEAKELGPKHPAYDPRYDVDKSEIPRLVDELSVQVSKNMTVGGADYMPNWLLKKRAKDIIAQMGDQLYDTKTDKNYNMHQQQFYNMIDADRLQLANMEYEFEAAKAGTDPKVIQNMNTWFAVSAKAHHLMTEKISLDKLKEGNKVKFDVGGQTVHGYFDHQDKDYIYMKFDNDAFFQQTLGDIKKYKGEYDSIVSHNLGKDKPTDLQMHTLKGLYYEGYTNYPKESLTKLQAADDILKALLDKKKDPSKWGRFRKSSITIDDYQGPDLVQKTGVERFLLQPSTNLNQISAEVSRTFMLGSPQSGWKLFQNGQFSMANIFGVGRYLRELPGSIKYGYLTYKSDTYYGKYVGVDEEAQRLKDFVNGTEPLTTVRKRQYGNEVLVKVLRERGFGMHTSAGLSQNLAEASERENVTGKVSKGLRSIANAWTSTRNTALEIMQIQAGHMAMNKAIFRDGITDQRELELVAHKAIDMVHGVYNGWARQLGSIEKTAPMMFQFSQFSRSIVDINKQEQWMMNIKKRNQQLRQDVELGTLDLKKYYNADEKSFWSKFNDMYNTKDPNITALRLRRFYYNTMAITAEALIPGFRNHDPVWGMAARIILTMAEIASRKRSSKDELGIDVRDIITGLIGMRFGVGMTMPLGILYSIMDGEPVSRWEPLEHSSTWHFAKGIYDAATGNGYNQHEGGPLNKQLPENVRRVGGLEHALTGYNLFTPTLHQWASNSSQELQSKGIVGLADPDNLKYTIPIFNMLEARK